MKTASPLHGTRIVVADDGEDAVREAAERMLAMVCAAIARRGRADIALGCGPILERVYGLLSDAGPQPDWSRVSIWQTDERFEPSDRPTAHAPRIRQTLLQAAGLPLPAANLFFFPVDDVLAERGDAVACVQRYTRTLVSRLGQEFGKPHLDLVVAELSPAGTVLSIFPESPAFAPIAGHLLAVPPPPHADEAVPRMTLTSKCFDLVPEILVVAAGADRRRAVTRSLVSVRQPRFTPAQLLVRRSATWVLDEAAAADLVHHRESA